MEEIAAVILLFSEEETSNKANAEDAVTYDTPVVDSFDCSDQVTDAKEEDNEDSKDQRASTAAPVFVVTNFIDAHISLESLILY